MKRKSSYIFQLLTITTILLFGSLGYVVTGQSDQVESDDASEMIPLWWKSYGGDLRDKAYSLDQTSDGGYIIAGTTQVTESGPPSYDILLTKTNSEGVELWSTTFGGDGEDKAYSVQQTTDGGYILTGVYAYPSENSEDLWLVKTDSAGNEEWNKKFGGTARDRGYYVRQTSDGGYIIVGETGIFIGQYAYDDLYLIKTDSLGNLEWERTFGDEGVEQGRCVRQTSDGGYIVTGIKHTKYTSISHVYLIKTDSSGNETWNITFGSGWDYIGNSVRQTVDSGFIVLAERDGFNPEYSNRPDTWLIKTDTSGNEQWNRTFGGAGSDIGEEIILTSDGGYTFTGYTWSYGKGDWNIWLVKTNSIGIERWNRTFGGYREEQGYSLIQTSDGGYVIAGSTRSFTESPDCILLKVDSEGTGGVKARPVCTITTPRSGETVSGKVTFSGTVYDPDGKVESLQISVTSVNYEPGTGWAEISPFDEEWEYTWDSMKFRDGGFIVYVRAYDGELYSDYEASAITIYSDNGIGSESSDSSNLIDIAFDFLFCLIFLIPMIIAFLAYVKKKQIEKSEKREDKGIGPEKKIDHGRLR